ncbi:MAG: transposase [Blastochloris sp.]|nr:transposase [Blastochloris sp.]
MRDKCLNMHHFHSVAEACVRMGAFRQHYNHERPHSRLGYLTPLAFKAAWYEAQAKQAASAAWLRSARAMQIVPSPGRRLINCAGRNTTSHTWRSPPPMSITHMPGTSNTTRPRGDRVIATMVPVVWAWGNTVAT